MRARLFAIVMALGALMIVGACSTPSDTRFVATPPDLTAFSASVGQVLVHHCGTLDCHGTPQRNLRIYGNEGLRLDAGTQPLRPPTTTQYELIQDYDSVVGLEPEIIGAVVSEGGAHPERLTFVRKARGQEAHKGGSPIHEGDDSDNCITSWLASKTDAAACTRASTP
jgi:hypothetical protein